jgi:hypothetical protein
MTDFYLKCDILKDFAVRYEEEYKEFIEFNDIGFPIAYFHSEGLVMAKVDGQRYVEETWELLLAEMDVDDTGFEDLDHLIESIPHQ